MKETEQRSNAQHCRHEGRDPTGLFRGEMGGNWAFSGVFSPRHGRPRGAEPGGQGAEDPRTDTPR